MRPFGEMDQRLRPQWLAVHKRWLDRILGTQHIITERNEHGIIWEEPDLVVKTILYVVNRAHRPAARE